MLLLLENEIIKTLYRKKIHVTFVIVFILVLLFAYGENYRAERTAERIADRLGEEFSQDWQVLVEQQKLDTQRRIENPYITDERRKQLELQTEQYDYYLQTGVNPLVMTSAMFTRTFMEQSILLFLPLLTMVLVTDLVSGEFTGKTIKLLLTKPVPRWRVLLSKILAMTVLVSILVLMIAVTAIIVASLSFTSGGWSAPTVTGFSIVAGQLDASSVLNIPQWKYVIMVYALAWISAFTIGALTILVSVLVKNTGIAIGVMMSTLIAGGFMQFFLNDWPLIKYLYMINLNLTSYLSGSVQVVEGMSFLFSFTVLSVWAILSLVLSFLVFIKQDVLV